MQRRDANFGTRGYSLVELMVTVVIVGVLAALAIYGVRRYVFSARTAEARNALGRMAKDASASFAREAMAGDKLALGGTAEARNVLCVSASQTVPADPAKIKGQKYQSEPAEWDADAKATRKGFACLHFSMADPQFYLYDYKTSTDDWTAAGAVGTSFDAIAHGDLNGDGILSDFMMSGQIQKAATGSIEVTVAPNITEKNALD
jgi:type IV pilus assembly protein PilA